MSEYPSLPKQGENLAKFAWDVIKQLHENGPEAILVSDEVHKKRLTICESCEHYDSEERRCKECGCFLDMKSRISLESGPIGAWTESNETWMNGGFEKLVQDMQKREDS